MKSSKVNVYPLNRTIEVKEGASLLESLKQNGILIKSSCGGVATCSDCVIKVLVGEDQLDPPSFQEIKLLGNVFHITKERLSCQARPKGEMTIDVSNQDQSEGGDRVVPKSFLKRKPPTKLRKKSEVDGAKPSNPQTDERKDRPEWKPKHWENKDNQGTAGQEGQGDGGPKRYGGGHKRPRTFRSDRGDKDNL